MIAEERKLVFLFYHKGCQQDHRIEVTMQRASLNCLKPVICGVNVSTVQAHVPDAQPGCKGRTGTGVMCNSGQLHAH